MHAYVSPAICLCVYMHVHPCVSMHVFSQLWHVCIHTCVIIWKYKYTCVHAYLIHVCTYIHMHIAIRTHQCVKKPLTWSFTAASLTSACLSDLHASTYVHNEDMHATTYTVPRTYSQWQKHTLRGSTFALAGSKRACTIGSFAMAEAWMPAFSRSSCAKRDLSLLIWVGSESWCGRVCDWMCV